MNSITISERGLAKLIKATLVAIAVTGGMVIYACLNIILSSSGREIELLVAIIIPFIVLIIGFLFQIYGKSAKMQGRMKNE